MRRFVILIVLVSAFSSLSQVMAHQVEHGRITDRISQRPIPRPLPTPTAIPPKSNGIKEPFLKIDSDKLSKAADTYGPGIVAGGGYAGYALTNLPKKKLAEGLLQAGLHEKRIVGVVGFVKSTRAPVKGALLAAGVAGTVTTAHPYIFKEKGPIDYDRYVVGGIILVIVFFGYLFLHEMEVLQ